MFFVFILIVASILFNKVYIFQTHDYFKEIRKGSIYDLIMYSLPFAVAFAVDPH